MENRQIRPMGAVRVKIPAKVAFELDSFQEVIGNLAEQLGCRACLSGADCTFSLERDYLVNPDDLKINPRRNRVLKGDR